MCVVCVIRGFTSYFFFSSRRRHTRCSRDWSSDVCSSDLLVQRLEAGRQHRTVLGDLVLVLLGAERLERIEVVVVASPAADRQRERRVRAARLERLEHFLLLDAGGLRELRDRRRAAELHRELLDEARE